MRIIALAGWCHAPRTFRSKLNVPIMAARALCGWALLGIAFALGSGALSPQTSAAQVPVVQLAFADPDPGPPPKREDYQTDVDYWLAYLRWLYAVNGGDPSKLGNTGVAGTATAVTSLFTLTGWNIDESLHSRQEILDATSEMIAFTAVAEPGVSPLELALMKSAAMAVQAAAPKSQ